MAVLDEAGAGGEDDTGPADEDATTADEVAGVEDCTAEDEAITLLLATAEGDTADDDGTDAADELNTDDESGAEELTADELGCGEELKADEDTALEELTTDDDWAHCYLPLKTRRHQKMTRQTSLGRPRKTRHGTKRRRLQER